MPNTATDPKPEANDFTALHYRVVTVSADDRGWDSYVAQHDAAARFVRILAERVEKGRTIQSIGAWADPRTGDDGVYVAFVTGSDLIFSTCHCGGEECA